MHAIGHSLAQYLNQPSKHHTSVSTCTPERLFATLQKGDVLLVEGNTRFSSTIKYLTQSTWSHATLYMGVEAGAKADDIANAMLIEADVVEGVRKIPLTTYAHMHTRICRPQGLNAAEINEVVNLVISRVGNTYDLKNVFDLARYLVQNPPLPVRWRRRMLAIGSGEPTQAICSSLIAQAFQSVRYPILPEIFSVTNAAVKDDGDQKTGKASNKTGGNLPRQHGCKEYMHVRHFSLFVPRDFDISPYFHIVKPTIEDGFDPHGLSWLEGDEAPNTPA